MTEQHDEAIVLLQDEKDQAYDAINATNDDLEGIERQLADLNARKVKYLDFIDGKRKYVLALSAAITALRKDNS